MIDDPRVGLVQEPFVGGADTPIDRATELFNAIIDEQHATGTGGGDHFAKPGANDRVWNALEKLAAPVTATHGGSPKHCDCASAPEPASRLRTTSWLPAAT